MSAYEPADVLIEGFLDCRATGGIKGLRQWLLRYFVLEDKHLTLRRYKDAAAREAEYAGAENAKADVETRVYHLTDIIAIIVPKADSPRFTLRVLTRAAVSGKKHPQQRDSDYTDMKMAADTVSNRVLWTRALGICVLVARNKLKRSTGGQVPLDVASGDLVSVILTGEAAEAAEAGGAHAAAAAAALAAHRDAHEAAAHRLMKKAGAHARPWAAPVVAAPAVAAPAPAPVPAPTGTVELPAAEPETPEVAVEAAQPVPAVAAEEEKADAAPAEPPADVAATGVEEEAGETVGDGGSDVGSGSEAWEDDSDAETWAEIDPSSDAGGGGDGGSRIAAALAAATVADDDEDAGADDDLDAIVAARKRAWRRKALRVMLLVVFFLQMAEKHAKRPLTVKEKRERLMRNLKHDAIRPSLYKGEKLSAFLGTPGVGSTVGGRLAALRQSGVV